MNVKTVLKVLLSIVLLTSIAAWVDLDSARTALANADPLYIVAALLVATVNRMLMAIKWNVLMRAKGVHVPWPAAVRIYYVSGFAGMFLPPTVGGDTFRCFLTIREYGHHANVVSSILVERLIGLLILLLYGALGGFLLYGYFGGLQGGAGTLIVVAAVLLVGLFGAVLFVFSPACRHVVDWISHRLGKRERTRKLSRFVHQLHESFLSYRNHPSAVVQFFLLTVIENALPILRAWIIGLSMNVDVPLSYYFIVVPVTLFVIRIPISFEGFGLREGVFVYFLSLLGVDKGVAFSMSLAQYLVFMITILPGAVLYLRNRRAVVQAEPRPQI